MRYILKLFSLYTYRFWLTWFLIYKPVWKHPFYAGRCTKANPLLLLRNFWIHILIVICVRTLLFSSIKSPSQSFRINHYTLRSFDMKLISTYAAIKTAHPPLGSFPGVGGALNTNHPFFRRKDKLVFIMGATGTGKSRLAIDLATRLSPAEIINSDKIQVYKGLDIVTNKVTEEECRGVPHHLLGIIEPNDNFTAVDFSNHASLAVDSILKRDCLPIIAGGSNSYIEALVNGDPQFLFHYDCCFLWVDVKLDVLRSFVSDRVDRMVEIGLVDEVRNMFDPLADYSRGIRRAIGVPELDQYLRAESIVDEKTRVKLLEAAISKIKEHTCLLARRQLQKIDRLRNNLPWQINRIDATEVFRKRGEEADESWKKLVVRHGTMIVHDFLVDKDPLSTNIIMPAIETAGSTAISAPSVPIHAIATAGR